MGRLNGDGTIVAPRPCWEGVYGVSDIHSPRYLGLYRESLGRVIDLRILILAGDIIDKGRHQWFKPVIDEALSRFPHARIIGVYGNEEYEEARVHLSMYPSVEWLDDTYTVVDMNSCSLAIVGTTGALDRLTRWQRRNKPELAGVYRRRPKVLARLIGVARREADAVVLVSHYALSRATITGEPRSVWPELYSYGMERLLAEAKPDAAVHGHAHKGRPYATVSGVPVYNVALPLTRKLTRIVGRIGLDLFL
ncbi:MAG: metallophosphoesterase [Desulfurococcales archaeon]|nr:metallophosphoesterase [Desulfurococcales archaeon]